MSTGSRLRLTWPGPRGSPPWLNWSSWLTAGYRDHLRVHRLRVEQPAPAQPAVRRVGLLQLRGRHLVPRDLRLLRPHVDQLRGPARGRVCAGRLLRLGCSARRGPQDLVRLGLLERFEGRVVLRGLRGPSGVFGGLERAARGAAGPPWQRGLLERAVCGTAEPRVPRLGVGRVLLADRPGHRMSPGRLARPASAQLDLRVARLATLLPRRGDLEVAHGLGSRQRPRVAPSARLGLERTPVPGAGALLRVRVHHGLEAAPALEALFASRAAVRAVLGGALVEEEQLRLGRIHPLARRGGLFDAGTAMGPPDA